MIAASCVKIINTCSLDDYFEILFLELNLYQLVQFQNDTQMRASLTKTTSNAVLRYSQSVGYVKHTTLEIISTSNNLAI